MTLKQDNPLSAEVEAEIDALLESLVPDEVVSIGRPDGSAQHIDQGKQKRVEAKSKLTKLLLEQRIDPFDFVQPCEPDCSKERHAYHRGQWDMATRISVHLNQLDKKKHE